MAYFYRSIVVVLFLVLMPGMSYADHMNGRYYGTGQAAGYILQLRQSGISIQAVMSTPSGETVQFSGSTDGGDYGSGQMSGAAAGSFEIQWSQQGVTINMYGMHQSGPIFFSNTPQAQPPTRNVPEAPRQDVERPEQPRQDEDPIQRREDPGPEPDQRPGSGMPNVD